MNHPKVNSVKALDDHTLLVEFDNFTTKTYDVTPLFKKEAFRPLRNYAFFRNVHVDKGGYAIFWNSDIDLSEHELWTNGKEFNT